MSTPKTPNEVKELANEKPDTPLRTPLNRRSLGLRRSGGAFKSPLQSPATPKTQEQITQELKEVLEEIDKVNDEIREYNMKGFTEEMYHQYIRDLHEYNDIKDAAQMIMGKLAEIRGTTVRSLHEQYDLPLKDE